MNKLEKINSNKIALISCSIWFLSLFLPAITTYSNKDQNIFGIDILLIGWLGFNAAWWANLTYIWSILKILGSKKSPYIAGFFTFILSLDTFRLDSVPLNAAGSTAPVFGYGLGAILWWLSIILLLIAINQRLIEQSTDSTKTSLHISNIASPRLSYFLFIIFIIAVSIKYLTDHTGTYHPSESKNMVAGVIKRGKVCRANEFKASSPAFKVEGALEFVGLINQRPYNLRNTPNIEFLAYGIPAVRHIGYDFYLNKNMLEAKKAKTPVDTKVRYLEFNGGTVLNIKKYNKQGHIIRSDKFEWEPTLSKRTCPPKNIYSSDERPEKIFYSSLGINKENVDIKGFLEKYFVSFSNSYENPRFVRPKITAISQTSSNIVRKLYPNNKDTRNLGCNGNVKLLHDFYTKDRQFKRLGTAFQINDHIRFLSNASYTGHFICTGENGYLINRSGSDSFYLRKLALNDLSTIWLAKVSVKGNFSRVVHIEEIDNYNLTAKVINKKKQLLDMEIAVY